MRALVCNAYGPPESLQIEEWEDPVPGPGQISVDIAAAGVNFPDMLVIAGMYQVKTEPPFIPGNEAAGTVAAIGDDVSRFDIGDRVVVFNNGGAFAEKCIADEATTIPLPDELDFAQGAGFSVTYGTSYHALKQCAQLQAGESLLVLGAAGGVGSTAVQIGKALGARVIAAASTDAKLAFARESGADDLINYSDAPLKESVRELTDGAGVDVVYDPVGGELADQAYRALAWGGRHLVIGFTSGEIPRFKANIALLKEAKVVGVWWGTWAMKNPDAQLQNLADMAAMIADGTLNPRITEVYELEDYLAAFSAIRERRAVGKVVLKTR